MNDLQTLQLHDFHLSNSAKFVPFAGWEMPVSFGRIMDEHRQTREKAGLFDVSHMGEIEIQGPDAEPFLDFMLTNSVRTLNEGKGVYSPMCSEDGGTVDDLIAYKKSSHAFLLCVNASNTDKDFEHFQKHKGGFDCEIFNRSSQFGQIAIQGPCSAEALFNATGVQFGDLPKMSFREIDLFGDYCLVARTGYTGEDGFEIYCPVEKSLDWARSFEEDCSSGMVRWVGLAARDSLRLEAGFPLYGHELSQDITPFQAGLGWTIDWSKETFLGKESLLCEKEAGKPGQVIFYEVDDRRIPRQDDKVFDSDREAGRVLSGGFSPLVEGPIGSAWVDRSTIDGNSPTELSAEVRGKRVRLRRSPPVLKKLRSNSRPSDQASS